MPTPFLASTGIFALQRVRQSDAHETMLEVAEVLLSALLQMSAQGLFHRRREHGHSILPPLAVPNQDLVPVEVQ
ncbi:MAG: hypothetical protein IH856_19800 [Deltaproteobacteria bacterium]|nr:hypothetical protein [Deltaproteobacteria bacterium]